MTRQKLNGLKEYWTKDVDLIELSHSQSVDKDEIEDNDDHYSGCCEPFTVSLKRGLTRQQEFAISVGFGWYFFALNT